MFKIIPVTIALLLLVTSSSVGQKHIERLKKWESKGQYAKIIRKSDKLIKEYPNDPNVLYYVSLSELSLSMQSKRPKTKYKHILNSIKYYNIYSAKVSGADFSLKLRNTLHHELKLQYDFYNNKRNKNRAQYIEKILSTTFKNIEFSEVNIPSISTSDLKTTKVRQKIINEAQKHLGKPYKYSAKGPESFDCSGFTRFVYLKALDHELPPNSEKQSKVGETVSAKKAQIGDLIFFAESSKEISHVGIITQISDNEVTGMIHGSSSQGIVIDENNLSWNNYWKKRIIKIVNIVDIK